MKRILYNNIWSLSLMVACALCFAACGDDPTDDFRYVAPGWEDTVGYTIEEVATCGFDLGGDTSWLILDSELSKSDSYYEAFKNEVNKYENVELNFVNIESVEANYFLGFTTITSLELSKATSFGIAAFEGLPLTSLTFGAEGEYLCPASSFNFAFNGFDNSENCSLMLGADEFLNVNITNKEWGGKEWLTIFDTNGNEVLSEPEERVQMDIDEMVLNTEYSTNVIWEIINSDLDADDYTKLNYIINYHEAGSVWLSLPYISEIPESAFSGCTGLYCVEFCDSATVGASAFYGCTSLTVVNNSETISSFGANTFYSCTSLRSIDLSGTTSVAEGMLRKCSSLIMVTFQPYSALSDVASVVIGNNAFRDCTSLTTLYNIDNILSMGTNVFNGCTAIKSIELPVAAFANFTFSGCTALESVTLPNCSSLGNGGFTSCTSLVNLYLTCDDAISLNASAFNTFETTQCNLTLGTAASKTIINGNEWGDATWLSITPADIEYEETNDIDLTTLVGTENYDPANNWVVTNSGDLNDYADGMAKLYTLINAELAGSITLDLSKIESIPDASSSGSMLYGCTGVGKVILNPDGVTRLGGNALRNCVNLTEVDNLDKVAEFGDAALYGCTSIQTANVSGATSLPKNLFNGCSSLATVTLNSTEGVTLVDQAFYNCTQLSSIVNSNKITSLAISALYGCSSLSSLDLASVTSIGNTAFSGCSSLTVLKLTSATAITTTDTSFSDFNTASCTLWLGDEELDVAYVNNRWRNLTWASILDSNGTPHTPATTEPVTQDNIIVENMDGSEVFNTTSAWIVPDAGDITAASYATLISLINAAGTGTVMLELNNVTSIAASSFADCTGLSSVSLTWADSASTKIVQSYVFKGATALSNVTLPNTSSLGSEVFSGTALTLLSLAGSGNIGYQSDTFSGFTTTECVVSLSQAAYDNASSNTWANVTWSAVVNYDAPMSQSDIDLAKITGTESYDASSPWIVINEGDLSSYLVALTRLATMINNLGDGVVDLQFPNATKLPLSSGTGIGFYTCTGLASLTLNEAGTEIGDNLFRECSNLTTITNFDKVPSIGNYAFMNCSKLTSGDISSASSMSIAMFRNCTALTSVTASNVSVLSNNALRSSGVTELKLTYDGEITLDDSASLPFQSFTTTGCTLWLGETAVKSVSIDADGNKMWYGVLWKQILDKDGNEVVATTDPDQEVGTEVGSSQGGGAM